MVAVATLAACSDPGGGPDAGADATVEPCTMTASLGIGGPGPEFRPLSDGDVAEVVLGYQGFRFIQLILSLSGSVAAEETRVQGELTIAVDGAEPYPQWARIDVTPAGDGAAYSAPVAIYFNDLPYSAIVDRTCALTAAVYHPGCSDTAEVRVVLRDEDPCIHGAEGVDGGPCVAPDAGAE